MKIYIFISFVSLVSFACRRDENLILPSRFTSSSHQATTIRTFYPSLKDGRKWKFANTIRVGNKFRFSFCTFFPFVLSSPSCNGNFFPLSVTFNVSFCWREKIYNERFSILQQNFLEKQLVLTNETRLLKLNQSRHKTYWKVSRLWLCLECRQWSLKLNFFIAKIAFLIIEDSTLINSFPRSWMKGVTSKSAANKRLKITTNVKSCEGKSFVVYFVKLQHLHIFVRCWQLEREIYFDFNILHFFIRNFSPKSFLCSISAVI